MGYEEDVNPCRPRWAGGKAHVFVNEQVARSLPRAFELGELGLLEPKHIIVSPEFKEYVDEALGPLIRGEQQAQIDHVQFGGSSERKLYGQQSTLGLQELPELLQTFRDDGVYVKVELVRVGSSCPSSVERLTQTTGEQPRCLLEAVRTWQAKRKRFSLLGKLQDLKRIGGKSTGDRAYQGSHESLTSDIDRGNNRNAGHGHAGLEDKSGDEGMFQSQDDVSDMVGGLRHLANWSALSVVLLERSAEADCLLAARAHDDTGSKDGSISLSADWSLTPSMVLEIFDRVAATYDTTPFPRSECQFKEGVKLRISRFESDVLGKIVTDCPLEIILLESEMVVVVRAVSDRVEAIVKVCCSNEVLEYVLKGGIIAQPIEGRITNRNTSGFQRAFDVVVPRVAAAMHDFVIGYFKLNMNAICSKLSDVVTRSQKKGMVDGPHENADRLRQVIKESFGKAFCQEDIGRIAARKWAEQREEHKQQQKFKTASRARSQPVLARYFRGDAWQDCPLEYRYVSCSYLLQKHQQPPSNNCGK